MRFVNSWCIMNLVRLVDFYECELWAWGGKEK